MRGDTYPFTILQIGELSMKDEKAAENTAGTIDHQSLMGSPAAGKAMRQSAQGVLKDEINRAENHLNALNALLNVIPWNALRSEDEEALWRYFIKGR